MADGMSGYATTFSLGGATGNGRNISFSAEAEVVDITSMSSSNGWRQFKPGIKDGGEITLEVVYDKAAFNTILGKLGGAAESFTITYPDSGALTGDAILTGLDCDNPYDDAVMANLTLKVDGEPAFAAA